MTRLLLACCLLTACSIETSDVGSDPAAAPAADAGADMDPLVVETDRGPVVGIADGDLRVFLGVPFAAPPVGALRLRPPRSHPAWSEPRAADRMGPRCPQRDGDALVGDEDCLYLNVWAHPVGAARPVMVFIHGGANVAGAASEPLFDGASLARATGAVLVTVDYRLGALGFMALPELADEGHDGETGSYGVLDQQAALRWVQANAGAFGGDPAQVMIFGESAGGMGVCAHTAAPGSAGLFRAALAESGQCGNWPAREEAYPDWQALAEEVGCGAGDRLACLRGVPATTLVEALDAPVVTPVIGGPFMPEQPLEVWRRGDRSDVALVVGTNADEVRFFIALLTGANGLALAVLETEWGYQQAVRALVGEADAAAVLERYPYSAYDGGIDALSTVGTDLLFACPSLAWTRAWREGGGTAWQYEFTAGLHGTYGEALGAAHAIELVFLFDGFDEVAALLGSYEPTVDELALRDLMQARWGELARGATIDAAIDGATWAPGPGHMELGFVPGMRDELRGGRCEDLFELGLVPN